MHPRPVARALALLVGLPAALVLLAGPAQACSCAGWDDAAMVAAADAVFAGEIVARREPPRAAIWSSGDPAVYEVEVTRVYKGAARPRQEVVTAVSGASCGLELPARGSALLFARVDGELLRADLCGGSRMLEGAPDEGVFGTGTAAAAPAPGDSPAAGEGGTGSSVGPWALVLVAALALAGAARGLAGRWARSTTR